MPFSLFPSHIPLHKRLFDLALALTGLILALPLMAWIALIIGLIDGKPVFFRQQRPGYKGNIFTLYKFRTMRHAVNRLGNPLPDSQRMTAFGRILRASSLDELPQLFNVVRGEMSWVGPRPLLIAYLSRYSPQQARRHDVVPGITGWAQIHGRNALTWEDKFNLDIWYVDHWSFWLDVKILLLTIWKVSKREGINPPGRAEVEEFLGNSEDN